MSLLISLDTDHTRFRVELPSGASITIPITEGGAAMLQRLLLREKAAELRLHEDLGQGHNVATATLKAWAVGQEASPTQQEIDHIANHKTRRDSCPFCRLEASRDAKKPRGELTLDDLVETVFP